MPRIIAEKYMDDNHTTSADGLLDYKFYCFNGIPTFLYLSEGLENHATAKISFVTLDWQFADFKRIDYKPFITLPEKPECFEDMLDICKKLSKGTKFLRVDLYVIQNKIYFSELTFFPCSGFMPCSYEDDVRIGEMLKL